jgi:hypothetical protein
VALPFRKIAPRTCKILYAGIVLSVAVLTAELAAKAVILSVLGIAGNLRSSSESLRVNRENLKWLILIRSW